MMRFVGEVYTVFGLKVKLQTDPAGVIVILLELPAPVSELSGPIVPENTAV